jgi:hypothetical protein
VRVWIWWSVRLYGRLPEGSPLGLHPAEDRLELYVADMEAVLMALSRPGVWLSRLVTAGSANTGNDVEDLYTAWQLDQELGVTLQMVDAPRVIAGEPRPSWPEQVPPVHCFEAR